MKARIAKKVSNSYRDAHKTTTVNKALHIHIVKNGRNLNKKLRMPE